MVAVCACLFSTAVHGNILSWSGGGGANAYWNNSANWGGAGTPANGDTIIFQGPQPNLLNTNNIANLVLNQIRFIGGSGGFDLRGNAFTLTNSIIATNTAGANIIENNITLATATNVQMVVSNGVSLTLDGALSGSVGVNKAGLGTLTYQGPGSNPYTGTTLVSGGTLQLNVGGYNAFGGPLIIGDGSGSAATVRDLQFEEISESVPITINYDGVLDLNNYNETIGPNLTLSGGTIQTSTATLTLSANSTITTTNGYVSNVYGYLNIGSGTLTLQGNGFLFLDASVNGSANVVQNSANGMLYTYLAGSNSFTGNYTANGGVVVLLNPLALGNTNNAMTLNGQAWLEVAANGNITNQSLTVNDYGTLDVYGPSTNSWHANFTLGSPYTITIDVDINCALNLNGPIGGSGGVTKIGQGRLVYAGTNNNTYAGLTTVNQGELDLAKSGGGGVSAIPPFGLGLVIGDGVDAAVVRNYGSTQIWGFAPMTITNSGVWDLNNYYDSAAPLTLNGGQITTGSGFCAMINTVNVGASSTVSGNVRLDSPTVVFSDNAYLYMNASVSSYAANYGLAKAGVGYMYLSASNSYGGLTQVQGGMLYVENPLALGGTNSGTVVSSGASLVLDGNVCVTNEALTLNGLGASSDWGALDVESGIHTWAGPVTNNANSTLDAWNSSSELHINGPITGGGGLELFGYSSGGGTHFFEGSAANTYAGTTTVDAGTTLVLNNTAFDGAIPHDLDINGTVRNLHDSEINNSSTVTIGPSGLLDLSGGGDGIGSLNGSGSVNLGANYVNSFGSGSHTYSGVISGSGEFDVAANNITYTLNGNNTYTGLTRLYDGYTSIVKINDSQPQSPVYVGNLATLGGSGTVGAIATLGNISPGSSPGILTSSNVTFASSGTFTVDLNGPTPGVGYDQLNVRGTNSLANATLVVNPGPGLPGAIGDQFTILNNDGADAITGTFNGLPNGSLFSAGGDTFRINYNGGTGNDVVLTLWGVTNQTITLNAVDRGWYDNTGHHVPSNGNYLAGRLGPTLYNDWFVFNVPVFSGSIVQAELIVNSYTNNSPYGQETYILHQVTNSIAALEAGGSGLTGIYNDLGDGPIYGIRSAAVMESGEKMIIPLNLTFMNDATAASGGQMALGGTLASLDPTNDRCLFRNSLNTPASDVQLRLTFGTALTINGFTSGWYDNTGYHNASNPNYFTGDYLGSFYRNFFTFGLPAFSSRPVNAQLLLNAYTNMTPDRVETYRLYDVTTPLVTLTNDATGATGTYADLGSGAVYGGRDIYLAESGQKISIPLNSTFLVAARAASPGTLAIGGALASLDAAPTNEVLFAYSAYATPVDYQLWLGFLNAPLAPPSFAPGSPAYLGNNQYQMVLSGTAGTTNEIQASFDFQNWDFIQDVGMTGTTATFYYTNTAFPYRFFRAEQLQ
jgi:autotransporter-associated beta strand protein